MTATTSPTAEARPGGAPPESDHPRARRLRSAAGAGTYASLAAGSLVALLPLVVVVMASVKTDRDLQGSGPFDLPVSFTLENYRTAFSDGRMAAAFVNTLVIWTVSLAGTIVIGSMAAYAIDRFTFHGRRLVLFLFLLATIVPSVTTQVATYQVVSWLDLVNSRWSAIALYTSTDIISIYIFVQFIRAIPRSLDEAALIDGASHLTIYRKIIFPLLKPAIATVTIIKGVAVYNDFYIPFLYMPDRDLGVVSTSLFRFKGPYGTHWEIISAGVMITIIPTLVVFLLLQRYFYNGLTAGATK